jgi:hypothetical protein
VEGSREIALHQVLRSPVPPNKKLIQKQAQKKRMRYDGDVIYDERPAGMRKFRMVPSEFGRMKPFYEHHRR